VCEVELKETLIIKLNMKCLQLNKLGNIKDHGFKNLHIVDLDGALTGETVNLDIIPRNSD
jgi:phosphoribosylformimino-5-aminoimidazole carboxamide ribotide isomerase